MAFIYRKATDSFHYNSDLSNKEWSGIVYVHDK